MAMGKINYDKGVIIKTHPNTGMDIFMYVEQPGVYLTAHHQELPEALALEAGYDVETLGKERLRNERKLAAAEAIDKEFSSVTEVKEEVVEERGDFKLISIGLGRHHIVDTDNNRLTANPLPLDAAKRIFDVMAGPKATSQKSVR